MRRRLSVVTSLVLALGLAAAAFTGCKQKNGDRCETDFDCESGVCSKGDKVCVASKTNATDAQMFDASPADASIDAKPGTPDAKPVDARLPDAP